MLVLGFFLLNGAFMVGSQPKGMGTPENITVQIIDSKTVEVFWATATKNVERFDITYNPTENRVVSQAAGDSHSIILRELRPNTQYQVTVTAVVGGKNYKSRRLVFKTSADPNDSFDIHEIKPVPTKPTKSRKSYPVTPEIINPDPTAIGSKYTPPTSTTVRGVEIGLVLLALVVWIIAIALFFHRWGKIRMLLPYQPDYKTQQSLKVPGTGTTIVSGCTGNSSSQGQQEGPGCVQHLRWSNRFFDDPPTAKKCSPSRRPLKPRVSSVIFPASPSFRYSRTSVDCDSPRIIRHAHSHSEFPMESIPLCQVNQPRSESPQISIAVPVIASSVNEKVKIKKTMSDRKKSSEQLRQDESEFLLKNPKETTVDDKVFGKKPLGLDNYRNTQNGRESSEYKEEKIEPSSEALYIIKPFHESPLEHPKTFSEPEKPKRYSRSSLKKQKVQYDDNSCKNVPIHEFERSNQEKEPDGKNRTSKVQKTQELRRKAFLRKVSLQDTYLNYNQDYWLDFKNSGRFHKSIDLGCFETEEKSSGKAEDSKVSDTQGLNYNWEQHRFATDNQNEPPAIKTQSKSISKFISDKSLKKSDSDPVIFPTDFPCENCPVHTEKSSHDSNELLLDVIAKTKETHPKTNKNWFFLPSNEDLLLFPERNGLIETDFDIVTMYNEDSVLLNRFPAIEDSSRQNGSSFKTSMDFSNFYEIKLNQSTESENENLKKSKTFNFEGGNAFFETFVSTSGDSDVSYRETDPLQPTESGSSEFAFLLRSSSPP